MLSNKLTLVTLLAAAFQNAAAEVHGEGYEGTIMGPVAFLWPDNRVWSADADNTAPCGSTAGVVNRTEFPLAGGSVALSIADDAWMVAFNIAVDNNPTTQSQFQNLITGNISEIEPGHQCYRTPTLPSGAAEGTNATIQLEYWASDTGRNQSFFACADITFVSVQNFDLQIPCFNVTAEGFDSGATTTTVQPHLPTSTSGTQSENTSAAAQPSQTVVVVQSNGGLTGGQKAGIAVGAIAASAAIIGLAVFFAFRRKHSRPDAEAAGPNMSQAKTAGSVHSA